MKDREGARRAVSAFLTVLEKYKYALLIILVGAVLLLLPEGRESETQTLSAQSVQPAQSAFDLEATEEKLAAALSKVEGAGEVTVILTVQNSARQVLAQDGTITQKEDAREQTAQTVVVSKGSGAQEPILIEQIYPDFQGALVICTGGEDAGVRLKLVEAVSALTGLGSDKISICKGK